MKYMLYIVHRLYFIFSAFFCLTNFHIIIITFPLKVAVQLFHMLEFIKLQKTYSTVFMIVHIIFVLNFVTDCFKLLLNKPLDLRYSKATFAHSVWHVLFSIWLQNLSHLFTYFLKSLLSQSQFFLSLILPPFLHYYSLFKFAVNISFDIDII